MKELVNPHRLEAKSLQWNNPRFAGGKVYHAVLSGGGYINRCRHIFKRPSQAKAHAEKLRLYLVKRYEREIAPPPEMVTP